MVVHFWHSHAASPCANDTATEIDPCCEHLVWRIAAGMGRSDDESLCPCLFVGDICKTDGTHWIKTLPNRCRLFRLSECVCLSARCREFQQSEMNNQGLDDALLNWFSAPAKTQWMEKRNRRKNIFLHITKCNHSLFLFTEVKLTFSRDRCLLADCHLMMDL